MPLLLAAAVLAAEDAPCGPLLAPPSLAPLSAPLPAMLRSAIAARPAGTSVAFVGMDGATSVCVEVAPGVRVSAPADAVALLPFTAARKGTVQRALVLASVGDHLRVNPSGPFAPGEDTAVLLDTVDLRVTGLPEVLGDLPLASILLGRTPSGALAAETRRPLEIRALTMPVGAQVLLDDVDNQILRTVVLTTPAVVGGVHAAAGDRFEITNGCEFSYFSAKTPNGTCDDVKDDRLVRPGE